MVAKANHSTQLRSCPSPLVLFGIDSRGKPKGARLAGFMRPAGHSCRSFDVTCTTSWSPPPRTEI